MSSSNKRDRGTLAALGMALVAIVLVSWFSQPINGSIDEYNEDAAPPWQSEDIPEVAAIGGDIKIFGDTYPQWIMAIFSVFSTGVSFLAVVWVKRTLVETRRIGQAQVRAYLSIIKAECRTENGGVFLKALIKNSGQSPAFHVDLRRVCIVSPQTTAQVQLSLVERVPKTAQKIPFQTIQAGETVGDQFFACETIGDIHTGPGSLIKFLFTLTYKDVFSVFSENHYVGVLVTGVPVSQNVGVGTIMLYDSKERDFDGDK